MESVAAGFCFVTRCLRPSILLLSLFGFSLASLLSVSLLTEIIMSWPGLGPLLLEAVMEHDVYVVVGAVTFSTLLLVGATTATDILLYAADPRIRAESMR